MGLYGSKLITRKVDQNEIHTLIVISFHILHATGWMKNAMDDPAYTCQLSLLDMKTVFSKTGPDIKR